MFGETLARLNALRPIRPVLAAADGLEARVADETRNWPVAPEIVTGEAARLLAFRRARVALAASGTVTLELALAGVPMVAAYRVGAFEFRVLRKLVTTPFILLPNLILGEPAVPELIQEACTAEALTSALAQLIDETLERHAQVAALARVRERVSLQGESPAARAARVVASELS